MTRIYQPVSLQAGSMLRLDEKASHHLARVLRVKEGEALTLFNGKGGEYAAVIRHIDKKGVDVEIGGFDPLDRESPVNIWLAQGISRGEKMDWIIQKAVELGVRGIVPLLTERGNVRLQGSREEKRVQHWQSVAISACEQCGRNRLPEILPPQVYTKWLAQSQADFRFVLTPHQAGAFPSKEKIYNKSIVLLIGPEGGLSDGEVEEALASGFLPLRLGSRILRTETAPLAALSIVQYEYGDLKD